MTEDAPVKSEAAGGAASEAGVRSDDVRKTPEPRESAAPAVDPADPSPPRLAPEAPQEPKAEDAAFTPASPGEEAAPQLARAIPAPPPSDKPRRGRPPGSLNKTTAFNSSMIHQMAQQQAAQQRINQQIAQQSAAMMHQMAHAGMLTNGTRLLRMNPDGTYSQVPNSVQQQLMQQGQQQHIQFLQQGGGGPNGLPLPVQQIQARSNGFSPQQLQHMQQQQMHQQQQQQQPNPNPRMVSILMPAPPEAAEPGNVVMLHATGRPGFYKNEDGNTVVLDSPQQQAQMHQQHLQQMQQHQIQQQQPYVMVNGNKRCAIKPDQLRLLLSQKQPHLQQHPGWLPPIPIPQPTAAAAAQKMQQQQQLTPLNLPDRLSGGVNIGGGVGCSSSNSKVSEWLNGQHSNSASGDSTPPELQMLHHPLQHMQPAMVMHAAAEKKDERMDEDEEDAIPQLADQTDQILNVESLKAEEAFQQEGYSIGMGRGGRKYGGLGRNGKEVVTYVGEHMFIESNGPTQSAYLDETDYEALNSEADATSDQDKTYVGKDGRDDDNGSPSTPQANGAPLRGIAENVVEWMKTRVYLDVPRDEREDMSDLEEPRPAPQKKKDGKIIRKRKTNELQGLCQMDFGPEQNRIRQKELPCLVQNLPALGLRTKSGRRSDSALSGSVANAAATTSAKGKGRRSLRNRESTDKVRECRACGKTLEELPHEKLQYPGYCNATCYRISVSRSPTHTEDEYEVVKKEEAESGRSTPEPGRKKESSTVSSTPPKRRSGGAIQAPTGAADAPIKKETPSAPKAVPKEETPTPGKRGRRAVKPEPTDSPTSTAATVAAAAATTTPKKESAATSAAAATKVKKEVKQEVEEKQSPPEKKRKTAAAAEEKKPEVATPPKAKKAETAAAAAGAAAAQVAASMAATAAVAAASPRAMQQQPVAPPPPVQLQPQRQPAAVLAVAPSAAPPAVPAATAAAPTAPAAPPAPAARMSVDEFRKLTSQEVGDWAERLTGKREVADKLIEEDCDGEALLNSSYEDFRNDLKLTLGMAKRLFTAVQEIKGAARE